MVRWIRFVVVCVIALALPLQGIASATMVHCGPSHERMHAGQTDADAHAAAGHHHGATAAHHHNTAAAPHSEAAAGHHHAASAAGSRHAALDTDGLADAAGAGTPTHQHHAAAQPEKFTDLGQYNCSACASCCAACALPSSGAAMPAPEFAPTVFVALVPSVEPFATNGPDRPPRLSLA